MVEEQKLTNSSEFIGTSVRTRMCHAEEGGGRSCAQMMKDQSK